MKTKVMAWRIAQMRLKNSKRQWNKLAKENIATLNKYYDAKMRLLPNLSVTEIYPEIGAAGEAIITECDKYAKAQEILANKVNEALSEALYAIGYYFGLKMAMEAAHKSDDILPELTQKCGIRHSLPKKFGRYWQKANQYRRNNLDGKFMQHGAYDPDGPMFCGFAKALGYKNGDALFKRIDSIRLARMRVIDTLPKGARR